MRGAIWLLLLAGACAQVPPDAVFSVDGSHHTATMRDARPDAAVARERLGLAPGAPLPAAERGGLEALMLNEALARRRAVLLGWRRGAPPYPTQEEIAKAAELWGPRDMMGEEGALDAFLLRHDISRQDLLAHVERLLVEAAVVELFSAVRDGDVQRCLEDYKTDLARQWDLENSGLAEEDRRESYPQTWAENWCRIAIRQRRDASPDFQARVREGINRGAEVVWHAPPPPGP